MPTDIKNAGQQEIFRTKEEILSDLSKQSFAQEIENDKAKSAQYIERGERAQEKGEADKTYTAIADQEIKAVDVYKRALILVGSGSLQLHHDDSKVANSRAGNGLPVSSYLSHGARVMIEIPSGSGDQLVNWLTSGDANTSGMSRKQTQQGAIQDGKIVYNRPAATHDVSIEKLEGTNEYALKEKKGFGIGLKDFLSNKILGKKTNHFSVDLALNAALGEKDSRGKDVKKPDGDHGHLYIHYIAPTKDKPGSMLIGIEGGSPTSAKHSKTGAADPLSAIDGSKWEDLAVKKEIAGESKYTKTIVPKKYQGMTIKLGAEQLGKITKLDAKTFGAELAYAEPSTSVENFQQGIGSSNKIPPPPRFEVSKGPKFDKEQPTLFKKLVNGVAKIMTAGLCRSQDLI